MLLHVDNTKFKVKPTGTEIGGIKARFTKSASIKDITVKQLADRLTAGKTVQPGVTPFSEESRKKGYKGTNDADFTRQTVFMNDIDNKRKDVPIETPAHVAEVLAAHNLKAAFMYETFNSTADNQRFRFAVVSDEEFTDKAERNRVQAAIIAAFPQADIECINSDRIFFGTDKGLIDGYTDYEAVCSKADLTAFADAFKQPEQQPTAPKAEKQKFGATIPTGSRHGTLVSFASTVLTKYGITENAFELFMQRVAQCEEPKPDSEIQAIWNDACRYYQREVITNPNYLSPAEYVAQDFEKSLEPYDYTDVGQATVIAGVYGGKLKYSAATKWLVYDGKVWQEDEIKAQGLAQDLTDRQLAEDRKRVRKAQDALNKATEGGDSDETKEAKKELDAEKAFRGYVLSERKTTRLSAALTEARPKLQIHVKDLDADGYLLNTPDGTADLRSGEMRPHDPNDYCTKITAISPSTEGAELFAEFLQRVTCYDSDLERYLQEVAGMFAVGKVMQEKLIIAYGDGGNGKSTLFNLLARVMGDYAGAMSSEVLTANCKKNKSPEYAELRGKRVIIAAELEEGMRLDTATVKKLCSTDEIEAEKKYKDPFKFMPSHTVVLYTNHLPKVGTTDKGTWDRLTVVPFNANFRGMKGEILNYADYLFTHSGGAVLAWIIEGARRFIANNYKIAIPECVKAAIAAYRENNDWLNSFLSECCEIGGSYTQKSGELYGEYRAYCSRSGDYIRSAADFKAAVEGAGYECRKTKTGAFWFGLRLTSEFAPVVPCDGRDYMAGDGR